VKCKAGLGPGQKKNIGQELAAWGQQCDTVQQGTFFSIGVPGPTAHDGRQDAFAMLGVDRLPGSMRTNWQQEDRRFNVEQQGKLEEMQTQWDGVGEGIGIGHQNYEKMDLEIPVGRKRTAVQENEQLRWGVVGEALGAEHQGCGGGQLDIPVKGKQTETPRSTAGRWGEWLDAELGFGHKVEKGMTPGRQAGAVVHQDTLSLAGDSGDDNSAFSFTQNANEPQDDGGVLCDDHNDIMQGGIVSTPPTQDGGLQPRPVTRSDEDGRKAIKRKTDSSEERDDGEVGKSGLEAVRRDLARTEKENRDKEMNEQNKNVVKCMEELKRQEMKLQEEKRKVREAQEKLDEQRRKMERENELEEARRRDRDSRDAVYEECYRKQNEAHRKEMAALRDIINAMEDAQIVAGNGGRKRNTPAPRGNSGGVGGTSQGDGASKRKRGGGDKPKKGRGGADPIGQSAGKGGKTVGKGQESVATGQRGGKGSTWCDDKGNRRVQVLGMSFERRSGL
jgi:hypothetical protein